jgi:hypothetical protein
LKLSSDSTKARSIISWTVKACGLHFKGPYGRRNYYMLTSMLLKSLRRKEYRKWSMKEDTY